LSIIPHRTGRYQRLKQAEEQNERMANTQKRVEGHFDSDYIEELIGAIPTAKKQTKHVGFREIRFKGGRVEFDYTVTTGKIINEGTMVIRHSSDDELGRLADQLIDAFGRLYMELERGH
jgi:hypothetical protein